MRNIFLETVSFPKGALYKLHRIIFDAVISCIKTFRYPFFERVLMYKKISETEFEPALAEKLFLPNYFVDISDFLNLKLEIMKIYTSELGEHPLPRSLRNIETLAVFRGVTMAIYSAEAFKLLKSINK